MDPAVIGGKLASSAIGPLIKKLFVSQGGPGAGLVDKPVRLSAPVSFRGEKRTLGQKELRKLARQLVERAARETREAPLDEAELEAVTDALELTLYALGNLELDDIQAVRLGHETLANMLYVQAGGRELVRFFSEDSVSLYSQLLTSSCLHIVHFCASLTPCTRTPRSPRRPSPPNWVPCRPGTAISSARSERRSPAHACAHSGP
ncbi:NACHT N-terminal Helical domain 1-containing protein [Streptomyces dysideae]|uniref:NACHT N-terminal Helical domain 1-containing protein n=1 Tax=Streptomyces dysideae TaxID=909626 RepID=UPI000AB7EF36|nr:hypothetical protein [Streptomyces dysideae]